MVENKIRPLAKGVHPDLGGIVPGQQPFRIPGHARVNHAHGVLPGVAIRIGLSG